MKKFWPLGRQVAPTSCICLAKFKYFRTYITKRCTGQPLLRSIVYVAVLHFTQLLSAKVAGELSVMQNHETNTYLNIDNLLF